MALPTSEGGAVQVHGMPPLASTFQFPLHKGVQGPGTHRHSYHPNEELECEAEMECDNSWLLLAAFFFFEASL